MFDRNKLSHSVIWPAGPDANIHLVNQNNDLVAAFEVKEPIKGSDLAKLIPADYTLDFENCIHVTMSGDLVIGRQIEFDTVVVTERAEVTFEERMARLERRELMRERERQRERLELQRLREQAAAREQVIEPEPEVIEDVGQPDEPQLDETVETVEEVPSA